MQIDTAAVRHGEELNLAALTDYLRGKIEGVDFRSSFMALGDGRHKLPVKGEILKAIGKAPGDRVTVLLEERIS